MADGLNDARAVRVAEILSDVRNLVHYIQQNQATPTAEEYYLQGYTLFRHCYAEAAAAVNSPYNGNVPSGNSEQSKQQLRAIIVDACVRRFRCQRAYLRIHAALRWANSRYQLLQGGSPTAAHVPHLQVVDNQLNTEIAAISDQHVFNTLYQADSTARKWLHEDPALSTIQQRAAAQP